MTMINRYAIFSVLSAGLLFTGCSDDDETSVNPELEVPTTYEFTRGGQSTVSFSGQTTRIAMADELTASMLDFDEATEPLLLAMYRNEAEGGGDANPFAEPSLNESDKSVRNKVAASRDFFSANTAEGIAIKNQFEDWIGRQVSEIFSNKETLAEPGVAGQIADGDAVRYVNTQGLEYNQLVSKGLLGALMTDQMLNNYLSSAVLDEGDARELNNSETNEEGENYTFMEHKWDEAYGYAYGGSADPADPNATLGDDNFINKYIGRVEADPDFAGIADEIYQAFITGRAAIAAEDYAERDRQAEIIRELISEIIGIRAVYYLQQGKIALDRETPDYGTAFHDLSEAYGFIYSLRFTRQPGTEAPYLSGTEVDQLLEDLLDDGPSGLWNVAPATLDNLSETIASRFDFTVAQAASTDL